MERYEERKQHFKKAISRLKEALLEGETDLVIDGVLHRYEFTFELAWKTLKDYLNYLGIEQNTGSPREIIQRSFENNIIENGDIWINMMLARNELSHLYDEETSREIYDDIKKIYILELDKVTEKLKNIEI